MQENCREKIVVFIFVSFLTVSYKVVESCADRNTSTPKMRFELRENKISERQVKFVIEENGKVMKYRQFLQLLGDEEDFREFFRESLSKSSFRPGS